MSSSVENRHQPEVNRRTVNVLLGLLGLSGLAYGINRAIKKGFGIDINFSKNHPDGDDPESFDEQLESALAHQEDQASPEHEALSEVSPEIQEALNNILKSRKLLIESFFYVRGMNERFDELVELQGVTKVKEVLDEKISIFNTNYDIIIENSAFITANTPNDLAGQKALAYAKSAEKLAKDAKIKMEEFTDELNNLIRSHEGVSDEDLIEEWKKSDYVNLEGKSLTEAMDILNLLQDGITDENGGTTHLLDDDYRALFSKKERLADIYQFYQNEMGLLVKGFNLETMELEIYDHDEMMPWYPGNGPDYKKGDGLFIHRSVLRDPETGFTIEILTENRFTHELTTKDENGEISTSREAVEVDWGERYYTNIKLFFEIILEIFPKIKDKTIRVLVQNEEYNKNSQLPDGFVDGAGLCAIATNVINSGIEGVGENAVNLARVRTIHKLLSTEEPGEGQEGQFLIAILFYILRVFDSGNTNATFGQSQTFYKRYLERIQESGRWVEPENDKRAIALTVIGSD